MAKRTWTEASAGEASENTSTTAHDLNGPDASAHHPQRRSESFVFGDGAQYGTLGLDGQSNGQQRVPAISRRVKACAACRKQKIKCIMDDRGPPCRRCEEKGLCCVLNKSLQALISERLPPTDALVQDLETVHNSVQTILRTLNLPPIAQLQSARHTVTTPISDEHGDLQHLDDAGPSCDNSPRIGPEDDDDLPKVPIHSVYHLTKLSALRSPEANEVRTDSDAGRNAIDDFISHGAIPLSEAERLYELYTNRLDHFFYQVGGVYSTLDAMRRASRILTAAILTVAALHDLQNASLYGICNREFRRLMSASIFERRIDRDYIRAMCVASYWLSDISWMVSGYGVRRAVELNLANQYQKLVSENSEEAADCVRLWYLLYICDQHLSTLYGRQSVLPEDNAILGWEGFMSSPLATDSDARLISQVVLLTIIHNIRELFGPDTGEVIPKVYLNQINNFSRQLDQWFAHWSVILQEHHDKIGGFPRKGVLLHYHFARLHLYSHAFRGLRNSSIPQHLLGAANSAINAATSIIDFLCTDPEIRASLVGMPSYLHSMTAFACMFLAKSSMIHGDSIVERATVLDLTSRLIILYRSAPVGKWHLVHLMANGLEKIAATLRKAAMASQVPAAQATYSIGPQYAVPQAEYGNFATSDETMANFDPSFLLNYDMSIDPLHLMSFGNDTFGLSPTNHDFTQ